MRWEAKDRDGYVLLANGSEVWFSGLDSPERIDKILGAEYATIFANEVSEIEYDVILTLRTRLAQKCERVIEGKPAGELRLKAYYDLNPTSVRHWTYREFVEKVSPVTGMPLGNPDEYAWLTMSPADNVENLAEGYLEALADLPRLQRVRFLEGRYLADVEGALWKPAMFRRVEAAPVDLVRVVVAVDPSGAKSTRDVNADEIGIVVCGLGKDGTGYVLEDLSLRAPPSMWATAAARAYRRWKADCIVVEANFGGPMAESLIRQADAGVRVVNRSASRGKVVRAEPVAGLYERGKIVHVGREGFEDLEDQLCSFTTVGYMGPGSPDRADALVWAIDELMLSRREPAIVQGFSLFARR